MVSMPLVATHERARYSRNHGDLPTLQIRYNERIQRYSLSGGRVYVYSAHALKSIYTNLLC